MGGDIEVEVSFDPEWTRVRRWREKQLEAGGFSEFTAFRLAMLPDLDYRKAVRMLKGGATELQITDLLVDD